MEGFLVNFTFCLCRITSSQWRDGASQRTGSNTGSSETPGASSGESQAGPGLSPVPIREGKETGTISLSSITVHTETQSLHRLAGAIWSSSSHRIRIDSILEMTWDQTSVSTYRLFRIAKKSNLIILGVNNCCHIKYERSVTLQSFVVE